MLVDILYLSIIIVGLYSYYKGRSDIFIISFFFIISKGFLFFPSSLIKNIDYALILISLISIIESLRNFNFWSVSNDIIAKILLIFLIYHLLLLILTLLLGYEDFTFAIQASRKYFIYTVYFIFRKINVKNITKSIKYLFYISIISGFAYLLQFVGVNLLKDTNLDSIVQSSNQIARYRNIPPLSIFFLFFFVVSKDKIKFKTLFIVFFFSLLILTMSRMPILLTSILVSLYLLFNKRVVTFWYYLSIIVILLPIFSAYLTYRNINETSFKDSIKNVFLNESFDSYSSEDGTLVFRFVMLNERFDYLLKNKQFLLTGVGFRHELSPNTFENFNFNYGTFYEESKYGKTQLVSIDITWVGILMHTGIIGVALYALFIVFSAISFFKMRKNTISMTMFLFIIFLAIGSFSQATFDFDFFIVTFVLLTLSYNIKFKYKYAVFNNNNKLQ